MFKQLILLATLTLTLSACTMYHMEIQQGNEIDQNQVAKLHTGMSQSDVLSIMGQPVLTQVFEDNSIDYVYTLQQKGGPVNGQQVIVTMYNSKVTKVTEKPFSDK